MARGKRREIIAHGSRWILRQEPGQPVKVMDRPSGMLNGRDLPGVSIMSTNDELKAALLKLIWPDGPPPPSPPQNRLDERDCLTQRSRQ